MPHPRPVSPLSFETCALPPYDIDVDDLIDSDDELDDAASALRRQRVEKLARSYLQGKPLFILSASLRGPLDEKWKNPWKKNRRHGSRPPEIPDCTAKVPESFVPETNLHTTKHQESESLPVGSRGPEIPASSLRSAERTSTQPRGRSSPSKSPRRSSGQSITRPGQGGCNQGSGSPAKPSGLPSSSAASHSAVPRLKADWLKKDRRLMNFTKFDPPSSPTLSIASRHSDKARRPKVREVQVQVPQTPAFPNKSCPVTDIPAKTIHSLAHDELSPRSTRPSPSNPHKKPKTSSVAHAEPSVEPASLRIVDSSSQLPRFEYRRWRQEKPELSQEDESILQEETILHDNLHNDVLIQEQVAADLLPTGTTTGQPLNTALPSIPGNPPLDVSSINHTSVQPLEPIAPDDSDEPAAPGKTLPKGTGAKSADSQSKEVGFADEEDVPNEDHNATFHATAVSTEPEQNETEENTCEDLPSAQQVPAPLGASDRIASLHSTAVPKMGTDVEMSNSLDTQLSTQAALFHAHKSFQEDLDSPAYYATTPGRNRAVHSPSRTNHSTNVTPFYRVEESIRHDLEHNTFSTKKNRIQAMSTQFMLDAATPFTFSTEQDDPRSNWKPTEKNGPQALDTQLMLGAATPYTFSTEKKHRVSPPDLSTSINAGCKRKRTDDESPSSPGSDSTSMDYEYHSAESSPARYEAAAHSDTQQQNQQSTANASLPLDLDETAPNTHQDGQGHQAVESFNLSQAIADAGSWLQQSFDFMKDLRGKNSQSQALNMDVS